MSAKNKRFYQISREFSKNLENSPKFTILQKFSEAVDRVSTITSEKSRAIKFRLLDNLINMTSTDSENGTATEDITVEYKGEEVEIGFNSKYILEMINQLDHDKLIFEFNDTNSPLIIKESSNNDLLYVLMPMRV